MGSSDILNKTLYVEVAHVACTKLMSGATSYNDASGATLKR